MYSLYPELSELFETKSIKYKKRKNIPTKKSGKKALAT